MDVSKSIMPSDDADVASIIHLALEGEQETEEGGIQQQQLLLLLLLIVILLLQQEEEIQKIQEREEIGGIGAANHTHPNKK
jgi:hypothetical protein